ncbi:MAG TPA: hypothetical protein VJ385_13830 [Fibrobacteria bacterium]|nr:hypothetical protein [Fibrobacteria bacterium]
MEKLILRALAAGAIGWGLFACATDSTDAPKLEIESPGDLSLAVGDTSVLWVVSKTFQDPNGRTTTTKPYTFFTLASSDPGVAKVIRSQQIVGVKAGTAKVVAKDDKSGLVTDSATVTVTVTEP